MASIVGTLFSGGVGSALEGGAKLVEAIKGRSPEDAVKLQEILGRHQDLVTQTAADIEKAQIQENVQLNDIAGQNVRADAQSGDKYTQRARPTIVYVGLFVIVFDFCVLALLTRWGFKVVDLPTAFWTAWTIVSTGYVCARTADKTLGGSGGTVSLPLGIKFDSKGD